MANFKSLSDLVDHLQGRAVYTFTRREAAKSLRAKKETLTKALQRLGKAGRIRAVRRGFYVIIPLEYKAGGTIPVEWFIDPLMKFVGLPYYAGVLTAAAYHGAAHQQPQAFQVVVPKFERPIRSPVMRIGFFQNAAMALAPVEKMKTFTGFIPVSTPAWTAIDLVRFSGKIGGLDAVMTVLTELREKIAPDALLEAARRERDLSNVQRLGWLLDHAGGKSLADPLAEWLSGERPSKVALDVSAPAKGSRKDPRWQVVVNASPESEA